MWSDWLVFCDCGFSLSALWCPLSMPPVLMGLLLHKRRLYTWTSPDKQHQNRTDYILCSQRWRSSIQSAKTRPGADCDSDHELLISKFRHKLKKEKAEEPEIKLPTSTGLWKKQESSRKTSISALLTMPKTLTVWITINCGKFWKGWEYQTTWPASWKICMQVRKQQLELDMEQQTGSK